MKMALTEGLSKSKRKKYQMDRRTPKVNFNLPPPSRKPRSSTST